MTVAIPDWVKDAIFYQIFPDRFAKGQAFGKSKTAVNDANFQEWGSPPTYTKFQGGNLMGVTEKLDYLVELGINAIYFNPIFASASNHRYHTHDYYEIDPMLGGNKAFDTLLKAAHKRGIRIILDGVFNHASRGFFQFNHLLECGEDSPYRDWFHVYHWPPNAYANEDPNYSAWWGRPALPKFNTNTPEVREFLWGVGTHWLAKGIDGWRLDVPNEIDDDSFWQEFRRRCKAINPDAYIVGELWGDSKRWLQGDQFDAQMNYPFTRANFGFFLGDNMDQSETVRTGLGHMATINGMDFAHELNTMFNNLYDPEIVLAQMNMMGSHDVPRTSTIARGDKTAVRLMYLCLMTVPGAPNIYYGDEIGMEGQHDPDCRRAFPWQSKNQWDIKLLEAIQSYTALRRDIPALRRGDFQILHATENVIVYQRRFKEQTAVIAINNSTETQTISCDSDFAQQLPERLVQSNSGELFAAGKQISLKGKSGRVWAN